MDGGEKPRMDGGEKPRMDGAENSRMNRVEKYWLNYESLMKSEQPGLNIENPC
jgi:hypothetical protein